MVNLGNFYCGFTNISPHVPAVSLENKRNFHPRWQAANMPLVVNIRYEKRLQPQFSATGPVKSTASSLHSSIQQDSAGFSRIQQWCSKSGWRSSWTYNMFEHKDALWLQDCAHCAAEGRAEGQDLLGPRRNSGWSERLRVLIASHQNVGIACIIYLGFAVSFWGWHGISELE